MVIVPTQIDPSCRGVSRNASTEFIGPISNAVVLLWLLVTKFQFGNATLATPASRVGQKAEGGRKFPFTFHPLFFILHSSAFPNFSSFSSWVTCSSCQPALIIDARGDLAAYWKNG
jgi:hypothetical protein